VLLVAGLSGCGTYPWETWYFQRLCEREAGIRISRTVSGVESVLQLQVPEDLLRRSRPELYQGNRWAGHKPYWTFQDPWIRKHPTNFLVTDRKEISPRADRLPVTGYASFETPAPGQPGKYLRLTSELVLVKPCATYSCYNETQLPETSEVVDAPKSRYSYRWEEVHPDWFSDRIAGMRYSIVDLKSGEVLATAQDFHLFGRYLSKFGGGGRCKKPDGSYDAPQMRRLVLAVLEPPRMAPMKKVYPSGSGQ
jgi:hypothetical protein